MARLPDRLISAIDSPTAIWGIEASSLYCIGIASGRYALSVDGFRAYTTGTSSLAILALGFTANFLSIIAEDAPRSSNIDKTQLAPLPTTTPNVPGLPEAQ